MTNSYRCSECGATNCKLWRKSYILGSQVKPVCWKCLESKGYTIEYGKQQGDDQVYDSKIGSETWVPAVPNLDGRWWGYTSVPDWWCAWWEKLPNKSTIL